MTFDEKVPLLLKREQQWFGAIIGRPIDENSCMNPISPSGCSMEEEAAMHIVPSPTLRPAQRIQIYNQQYWWRLLNTLHESFPLVTRLFGYFDFNQSIGIPYLTKYPPRHWSLGLLGDRLSQWCLEDYHGIDKQLVHQAAELDCAFSLCFISRSVPSLTQTEMAASASDDDTAIGEKTMYIQPYIHLFEWEYDLLKYRTDFLKHDCEYWINNDFPILERSKLYRYVLYRNWRNDVSWKEISEGEYLILCLFQKGASIDSICELLERPTFGSHSVYEDAVKNLQLWFQEWTQRGWLCLKSSSDNCT